MKPKPKIQKDSPYQLVILPDFFASAENFPFRASSGQSPLLHGATVELSPGQWIPSQLNDMHTHTSMYKWRPWTHKMNQFQSSSFLQHMCGWTTIWDCHRNISEEFDGSQNCAFVSWGGLWNFPKRDGVATSKKHQKTWVLGIVVFDSMKLYQRRTHASTFPI